MKSTFLVACFTTSLLFSGLASAGQCKPVIQFINLGKKAEKCVSKIEAGDTKAGEVMTHYGFCTNVRDERDQVQHQVNTLPATTLNNCAEKDLQAYSNAATALQRMYQIELQMK